MQWSKATSLRLPDPARVERPKTGQKLWSRGTFAHCCSRRLEGLEFRQTPSHFVSVAGVARAQVAVDARAQVCIVNPKALHFYLRLHVVPTTARNSICRRPDSDVQQWPPAAWQQRLTPDTQKRTNANHRTITQAFFHRRFASIPLAKQPQHRFAGAAKLRACSRRMARRSLQGHSL